MEKRFMSVCEVAEYLGFSVSAIRKWIRCGQIPFYRVNGGIRFDIRNIDSWADKQAEQMHSSGWRTREFSQR